MEQDNAPRLRQMSEEVRSTKAAKDLIAPISSKIAGWQVEVRKLEAIGASRRGGTADLERARVLVKDIQNARHEFATIVQGLDRSLARHSRVTDIRKALATCRASLDRAIELLEVSVRR